MSELGQPLSGEETARIGTAARDAVKGLRGAAELGSGDIDMIVASIGGQDLSAGDREARAGGMARTMVEAQAIKPINFSAATREEIARYNAANGLFFGGRDGRGWAGRGGTNDGGTDAASTSTSSGKLAGSAAYGRAFAGSDPAFLRSVGINSDTASALAGMGFKSQAEVKALVHDADALHIDKNRGAVALGMMKSDDPGHYQSHMNFFKGEYKQGLDNIAKMDAQIEQERDPTKKAALVRTDHEGLISSRGEKRLCTVCRRNFSCAPASGAN